MGEGTFFQNLTCFREGSKAAHSMGLNLLAYNIIVTRRECPRK